MLQFSFSSCKNHFSKGIWFWAKILCSKSTSSSIFHLFLLIFLFSLLNNLVKICFPIQDFKNRHFFFSMIRPIKTLKNKIFSELNVQSDFFLTFPFVFWFCWNLIWGKFFYFLNLSSLISFNNFIFLTYLSNLFFNLKNSKHINGEFFCCCIWISSSPVIKTKTLFWKDQIFQN